MTTRIFVGEQAVQAMPPQDRGLAYGDGLFETMRAHRGDAPWWDAHWARLQRGAQRLRMRLPDEALVREQATRLLDGGDSVLKLIVTRGAGGRGYAPTPDAEPTWQLSTHPLPTAPRPGGLHLRWCETRLAIQPVLAGLKHCNRLEQVLARSEWPHAPSAERDADEGLMRSMDGDVICATMANLFMLRDGHWSTPALDRCGVAGICRDWLLAETGAEVGRITVTQVEVADALILCNAVRGILPVAGLGSRTWLPHAAVSALRDRLAQAHPGFAQTLPKLSPSTQNPEIS